MVVVVVGFTTAGLVVTAVGEPAAAGFAVVVVVLVLLMAAGVVVWIAVVAVSDTALCIARGIWTTDSGDLPVRGATETILALCVVVAGVAKLKCIAQVSPPAAAKTTSFWYTCILSRTSCMPSVTSVLAIDLTVIV